MTSSETGLSVKDSIWQNNTGDSIASAQPIVEAKLIDFANVDTFGLERPSSSK